MEMEKGEGILKAIRFVRDFMKQVSLVLQDADRLMGDHGWECVHRNIATKGGSNALEGAPKWLPYWACRFYAATDEDSNTLVCISVVMDDKHGEYQNFTEPLLAGAVWTFDDEITHDDILNRKGWGLGWCDANAISDDIHDGRIVAHPRETWSEEEQQGDLHCLGEWSFGYPIIQLSSAADIEQKIVKPLLALIEDAE